MTESAAVPLGDTDRVSGACQLGNLALELLGDIPFVNVVAGDNDPHPFLLRFATSGSHQGKFCVMAP